MGFIVTVLQHMQDVHIEMELLLKVVIVMPNAHHTLHKNMETMKIINI